MPYTIHDVQNAQVTGPSATIEPFTEFNPERTAEAVCAFANRTGGQIFFGVHPMKEKAGVTKAKDDDHRRPGQNARPVREWRDSIHGFFEVVPAVVEKLAAR